MIQTLYFINLSVASQYEINFEIKLFGASIRKLFSIMMKNHEYKNLVNGEVTIFFVMKYSSSQDESCVTKINGYYSQELC